MLPWAWVLLGFRGGDIIHEGIEAHAAVAFQTFTSSLLRKRQTIRKYGRHQVPVEQVGVDAMAEVMHQACQDNALVVLLVER